LSLTGDQVLIPGFVIKGTGTKRLLIRAVGPTLGMSPFNIGGVLPDPTIVLKRWDGTGYLDIGANDNWGDQANADEIQNLAAQLLAFGLQSNLEAAILVDLPSGQYTAVASGVAGSTGIAIVELYEVPPDGPVTSTMTSISNRGFVGIGNQVMIPGFVVSNHGPKTFLIRAVGPALNGDPFNVSDTMVDPQLTVFRRESNGAETNILSNDNWSENPDAAHTDLVSSQVLAFELENGSADASLVATLLPGIYTVVGSSVDGVSTGVVIVEVYVVE
jgi:hypothetical protein